MPTWIALDADDTLWHNEGHYSGTQARLASLLAPYVAGEQLAASLYATEVRNLQHFGYGVKGFTLSMIETAIELTAGTIAAADIQAIIELGREMLRQPVTPIDGVPEVLAEISASYSLLLVTKGDLFDQETKLARSGLAERFAAVAVVSEKDEATYRQVFARHGIAPADVVMVGNSVRSDILPVIAIGGRAVHIPYHTTWAHELVADQADAAFATLSDIRELPRYLSESKP